MKKMNIVKKNTEFNNIIKIGKKYQSKIFYIYVVDNNLLYNRYGIAISKKIGNAVVRNLYKRRVKDIIDDIDISIKGKDIVFIAKTVIKNNEFQDIKIDVIKGISVIGE